MKIPVSYGSHGQFEYDSIMPENCPILGITPEGFLQLQDSFRAFICIYIHIYVLHDIMYVLCIYIYSC